MDLLYGVCLKYLKDPALAQDAVMGVFETLIVQLPRHDVSFFRAWVYQVTKNYCLMQLRKNSRGPRISPLSDMELAENGHQGEAQEKEFRLNRLEGCLETLSPEQKQAVALFYLEEKCYNDIVLQTGLDWNRVRSLIQNGKRNLKICMEKQESGGTSVGGKVNK